MTKSDEEILREMIDGTRAGVLQLIEGGYVGRDRLVKHVMLVAYRVARAHVLDEAAQIARDALEQAQVSAYGGIAYARIMDMKDRTP